MLINHSLQRKIFLPSRMIAALLLAAPSAWVQGQSSPPPPPPDSSAVPQSPVVIKTES